MTYVIQTILTIDTILINNFPYDYLKTKCIVYLQLKNYVYLIDQTVK